MYIISAVKAPSLPVSSVSDTHRPPVVSKQNTLHVKKFICETQRKSLFLLIEATFPAQYSEKCKI
jgi:hypothetical protein